MKDWESLSRNAISEFEKKYRNSFSRKVCLAPLSNCSGKYVNAHTISKERYLAPISEGRHEYTYSFNPWKKDCSRSFSKTGIGGATCFYGFCSKHDNELFSNIDDKFYVSSPKQNFLFAYRSVVKEFYASESHLLSRLTPEEQLKINPNIDINQARIIDKALNIGFNARHYDLKILKDSFDQILLSEVYSKVSHYCIRFNKIPTILTSSIFAPWYDFNGQKLQDFGNLNRRLRSLIVNVIPVENGGVAIFSYLTNDWEGPKGFIQSLKLISSDDITYTLINMIFSSFDNLACKISWWDNLSDIKKEKLIDRLKKSSPIDPSEPCEWFSDPVKELGDWEENGRWEI